MKKNSFFKKVKTPMGSECLFDFHVLSLDQKDFEKHGYNYIITLLDYRIPISKYIKHIKLSKDISKGVFLIDTALCSGINEYRFILYEPSKSDELINDKISYVEVSPYLENVANSILKGNEIYVKNSILPNDTILRLINN